MTSVLVVLLLALALRELRKVARRLDAQALADERESRRLAVLEMRRELWKAGRLS